MTEKTHQGSCWPLFSSTAQRPAYYPEHEPPVMDICQLVFHLAAGLSQSRLSTASEPFHMATFRL